MVEEKFAKEAKQLREAIERFNQDKDALDNFEYYLAIHFDVWMKKWAINPVGLAYEFMYFSKIYEED